MLDIERIVEGDIVVACNRYFVLTCHRTSQLGLRALARQVAGVDQHIALWQLHGAVMGVGDAHRRGFARFGIYCPFSYISIVMLATVFATTAIIPYLILQLRSTSLH